MQEEMETAPVVAEKVPETQGTHISAIDAPADEEYLPATQEAHTSSD